MLSWPFPTILVFYLTEKRRFSGIENIKIVKQAKKMSAISDKGLKYDLLHASSYDSVQFTAKGL